MTDKYQYQLTDYLDHYPTEYLETFRRYKETSKCIVKEKKGKYAVYTTGELVNKYRGSK